MSMGLGIEKEVVESSFHGGFAFLSMVLFLILAIGITNQIKHLKDNTLDDWKVTLFIKYLLGFILSLGFYFLLVYMQ